MTYVRLDDKMPEHPKVVRLSDRAFRVHIQGICYSQRLLTDGKVPAPIATGWGRKAVLELVERGLWDADDDEYAIHDFLEWNDSRESILSRRKKDSYRKAKGTVPDSSQNPSGIQTESEGNPQGFPLDTASALVPVAGGSVLENKESGYFVEFYENSYPRREGRGAARTAWEKAVRKADPLTIIAGACRFAADPNREDGFTPHPATWLNQERWSDDPLPPRSSGKARSVSNILAMADRLEEA